MLRFVLPLTLVLATTPALAQVGQPSQPQGFDFGHRATKQGEQPKSGYDWRTNSLISAQPQQDGSVKLRGTDLSTNTTWRSTVKPDGSQKGVDAAGNSWRASPSGMSINSGTGQVCVGTGYARTCTGGN